MAKWTTDEIPDLAGKRAVVTGANSGLGLCTALELARHGATVVLACRSAERGRAALDRIRAAAPGCDVALGSLDLADLASVRAFAAEYGTTGLDLLVNNAGVMALPRRTTADGFEMQFGTNHLGHFALTGLLLPRLLATPAARIVTMSSGAHRMGAVNFDDLHGKRSYGKWSAYGQSKLANLLFAYELDRRLKSKRANAMSVACHPGYSATELQAAGPKMEGSGFMERVMDLGNRLFAQDAATGALPTLYAATAPDVQGGDYIGPNGIGELWGYPKKVQSNARSHDREVAARLWKISEEATGVVYGALDG
jgi:NAD(P)-dependent dehydrogenase (short-subunit alcohol dehydrogenase family)